MPRVERRLLEWDRRWLHDTGILDAYRASPLALQVILELTYLLTYAMAPAGAAALAIAAPQASIDRYWVAVLGAGLCSYAALPWLQTRPPRFLEGADPRAAPGDERRPNLLRCLNHGVLGRASIGVNTIPSGHAAVALATALTVTDALPAAGVVFIPVAIGILLATVLGRYHYAIDTLLGMGMALAAWILTANL
jgi:hypothetical protein